MRQKRGRGRKKEREGREIVFLGIEKMEGGERALRAVPSSDPAFPVFFPGVFVGIMSPGRRLFGNS